MPTPRKEFATPPLDRVVKPDHKAEDLYAICMSRECRQGAGQFVRTVPFQYKDDLLAWARHHHETTGHLVLVPFKIYERKDK